MTQQSSTPTARFTDRAGSYAAHRPTYPAPAIDALIDGLGDVSALNAADIGAGTGISSRLLADRGISVIAIEPNQDMRQRGESEDAVRVQWCCATGENTGLDDNTLDLILCAQAFHWLDTDRALTEFRRILRPSGQVALIWNIQDRSDPFTLCYYKLLLQHAIDYPRSPSFADNPPRPLKSAPGWDQIQLRTFNHAQLLDRDGLVGRAVSASYCPKSGPAHEKVVNGLNDLYDRFQQNGTITLSYITELHTAIRSQ